MNSLVCPVCGKGDAVRKVSGIYRDGTSVHSTTITSPGTSSPSVVGGHENLLNGGGQKTERWRPRKLVLVRILRNGRDAPEPVLLTASVQVRMTVDIHAQNELSGGCMPDTLTLKRWFAGAPTGHRTLGPNLARSLVLRYLNMPLAFRPQISRPKGCRTLMCARDESDLKPLRL
jgi:hypothetical protein